MDSGGRGEEREDDLAEEAAGERVWCRGSAGNQLGEAGVRAGVRSDYAGTDKSAVYDVAAVETELAVG